MAVEGDKRRVTPWSPDIVAPLRRRAEAGAEMKISGWDLSELSTIHMNGSATPGSRMKAVYHNRLRIRRVASQVKAAPRVSARESAAISPLP